MCSLTDFSVLTMASSPLVRCMCEHCGRRIALRRLLQIHMRLNHSWKCDDCEETFPWKEALERHFEEAHVVGYGQWCDFCQKMVDADHLSAGPHRNIGLPRYLAGLPIMWPCLSRGTRTASPR